MPVTKKREITGGRYGLFHPSPLVPAFTYKKYVKYRHICEKYLDIIRIERRLATLMFSRSVTRCRRNYKPFTLLPAIIRCHTSSLFDTRDEAAIFATRSINNRY